MMEKINIKLITIFVVCSICITLIGIAIWGARPIEYSTKNIINVNKSVESTALLNKQFESYKDELKENYNENINSINNKFNIIITLIGLVITVWIGINIYNIISKEELKKLKISYKSLKEKFDNLEVKSKTLANDSKMLKKNFKGFKNEIICLKKNINNFNKEIKSLNKDSDEITKKFYILEENYNNLKEKFEDLEESFKISDEVLGNIANHQNEERYSHSPYRD
ncbi:hypothetical protein [Clostridium baratii]|uniref:hypothetical protein n=1 Tax=Clostridium baratii TaxID=1561 RepID=UPI001C211E5E|nr:hypothetical protein [Clostridium baratii]